MGCNYLSLPEIPASGDKVIIYCLCCQGICEERPNAVIDTLSVGIMAMIEIACSEGSRFPDVIGMDSTRGQHAYQAVRTAASKHTTRVCSRVRLGTTQHLHFLRINRIEDVTT